MHNRLVTILAVVTAMAKSPAAAQDSSAAAGCLKFDRRYFGWILRDTATDQLTAYTMDTLRLLPQAHEFGSGWAVALVSPIADSVARLTYRPSGWSLAGDSVLVWWTTGFHGVAFRLAGRDTLVGTSQVLSDKVTLDSSGPVLSPQPRPVKAWRIACPP